LTEFAAAHPGHLAVLPLDVDKERSIAELVREVAALTDTLDALINNAGVLVSGERFGSIAGKSLAETFAANVIGPVLLTQALSPLLEKGSHSRVMNITSILGSIGDADAFGTPSYAISKAALNMATRQLAHALGPRGVTVFCAHPGWVKTDMGGAGATLDVKTSAAGIRKVIDKLNVGISGQFFNYSGENLPW